jgi:4-alpha-glucanotransferase
MNPEIIDQLSQARGIESEYTDMWGNKAVINQELKQQVLAAMGYPMEDEAALIDVLNTEAETNWLTFVEPVTISKVDEPTYFCFKIPIDYANDELNVVVKQNGKTVTSFSFVPVDSELLAAVEIRELEIHQYMAVHQFDLSLGYYEVELMEEGVEEPLGTGRLIVAPNSCYKQPALLEGKKLWGPSIQLYSVKTKRNWGIGDFTDLNYLVEKMADNGADFIGLNPIHALYPNNPDMCSPYSPSSRRWLNVIYIDVESVDGFKSNTEVQTIVNSSEFKAQLIELRNTSHVNYHEVMALKLKVLKPLYQGFVNNHIDKASSLAEQFSAFKVLGEDSLKKLATYDAIQDIRNQNKEGIDNNWGWPVWPKELQDYDSEMVQAFVNENAALVDFYAFLQFIANLQLEGVANTSKEKGMTIGTYRDLAVGVSEGSTEIWGNQDLYRTQASVGAPPDVLGPLGQNWGLPPMDPIKLYEQAYQPIIDLFRSNMQACGALRIDHVMALVRLWWVPKGNEATKGAYVQYPVDDLLAILALESHLNQCSVIGEDLGTVPEGISEKLTEYGVHSYKVFFFERAEDGGFFSPSHYVEQAMATLTTHDMPTLIGYWHCKDIELGQELGLYTDASVIEDLYNSRAHDKQQILNSLHGHNAITESIGQDAMQVAMTQSLNYSLQLHMAIGNSALLSLQLEDWLQMDMPVNVPGTSNEYPNWRRKLSTDLEDMFEDDAINKLAKEITKARQQVN